MIRLLSIKIGRAADISIFVFRAWEAAEEGDLIHRVIHVGRPFSSVWGIGNYGNYLG